MIGKAIGSKMACLQRSALRATASSFVLVLLLAAAGGASLLMAQSPGRFTATGDMMMARFAHTATLLHSGKVLIAGGFSRYPFAMASAELYDPGTGAFTRTGDMTTPRAYSTATLLADGKVLIAGGYNLATAELYDPSTGIFTTTGSMVTTPKFYTATLLRDGRVLFTPQLPVYPGTAGSDSSDPARSEIYDPSTGMFRVTAAFAGAGGCAPCAPATLLADGKVLFVAQHPAQLYDPGSETVRPTGFMIYPSHSTSILLTNGQVLFAGGMNDGRSAKAELYDPSTGAFASSGELGSARIWHTATLLTNGTVLVTGGYKNEDCCYFMGSLASGEIFDPSTGAFSATGDMTARRENHTATLLNDGRVLIAGGESSFGSYFGSSASAELYESPSMSRAPVLRSLSNGQGAILHADTHQVVSPMNPATVGEALEIYGSGLIEGGAVPPQIAIGGRMAEVLFFGNAPGIPGLSQVNVRTPSDVAPGPTVPVRLTYLGRSSNEVTLAVQ